MSGFVHAFVRITPGHEKTGAMTGRFLPYPAIYAVYKLAQPPDSRTYSAEVTSFLSNLPHHRRLRPFRRSVIIQHPPVCVKRFCKKILADFPGFSNAALWVFQKTRESPPPIPKEDKNKARAEPLPYTMWAIAFEQLLS